MPAIDLRKRFEDVDSLGRFDVCIVGTGPAGATLARELSGSSLRVVVVESGDVVRDGNVDLLNEIENVGRARQADQWSVRNRILGGSSHTWGGRCAPFDAVDFEDRHWVPQSGWPFQIGAITSYLDRSAAHLGLAVGTGFTGACFWSIAGRKPPMSQPDPASLLPFFWQFSRDNDESYPYEYMRFGRNLAARLGSNVTLITGATVLHVDAVDSGKAVQSVLVAAPDLSHHSVEATNVVLCTGGIENARILLSSQTVDPHGLGNSHDLVGRYLMDHPRGSVGSFDVSGSASLQKRLGRYNVEGRMFRAGFRLSPQVQRREGLLNCSAWLGEEWADDDPWGALRRIAGGSARMPDVLAVVRNGDLLVRGVRDYFIQRNGVPRKLDGLNLDSMVEQRPDRDSRVTLSDHRDAFGMRLPRVDWRVHADEGRTLRRMATLLAEELPRIGLPEPRLADWVRDHADLPQTFLDVAHPTGTTRMSTNPMTGVVDSNLQVHGVDGLYVAGSSVFPTSGHANPTQMIVAMAIRLADHLRATPRSTTVLTRESPPADRSARVLLTGGTGRIGRVVLGDLLARGYIVCATTSREVPVEVATQGPEWRRFDLLEAKGEAYDDLVQGHDVVVHLAAEIGRLERMAKVNTEATRHLAQASERAGIRAFVYTSTVSVYGSGYRRVVHEDAPVLTVNRDVRTEYLALDYVRAYGRTKLAGEFALRSTARAVRYVILRPTVVVDIAQIGDILSWHWVKRTLAAHRHAHHVYVRDVSEAICWSIERALSGVGDPGGVATFNVSEDEVRDATHADFLRKARAALGGRRVPLPPVPGVFDWAHDLLRFRTATRRNPLWRMRFPNDRLLSAGYRFRFGMGYANDVALQRIRTGKKSCQDRR